MAIERPKPLKEGQVTEGTFATYCGLCWALGLYCSSFRGSTGRLIVSDHATIPAGGHVYDCPPVKKFMARQ